jgi:hypothetical protein
MQRILRISCAVLFVFFLLSWVAASAQSAPARPAWKDTNEKALRAVSGDPAAIDALVDSVLQGDQFLHELSTLYPELRSSLISAETAYRHKTRLGIPDTQVTNAVNSIAKRVGAPAFAYTNCSETRRLRMKSMVTIPALFAVDLKRSGKNGKIHIRDSMSPVEAVYLLGRMVDQKLYNPGFQLTPSERRAKWTQLHAPQNSIQQTDQPNPRTNELLALLQSRRLSLRDEAAFAKDLVAQLIASKTQEGGTK